MGSIALGVRGLGVGRGGEEWTPAQPTAGGYSPEHWYRSDQGLWQDAGVTPAAADGDVVGRWEDLTANADHVNQANAAKKPTLQNGAGDLLNGQPVVRFDGIDDFLSGTFTIGGTMNQPNTIFLVVQLDAAAVNDDANHWIMDGISPNFCELGKYGIPNPDVWIGYAGAILSGGVPDSNWNIWISLINGAASQIWLNGISEAGPGNAGALNLTGLAVGATSGGVERWNGDMVEIILYDASLSDADKNQVGQYLASRYGLAYTDI